MASNSETGHAKNIANLNLLNTHIIALGELYNPSSQKLSVSKLADVYENSSRHQTEVNACLPPYSLAVDEREALFKPLSKELTKLGKAYKTAEGVTEAQYEDFKTIVRKIKGERKEGIQPAAGPGDEEQNHSVSQLSYDQRTNNMELLVAHLKNTPGYNPNEDEYKVEAYQNKKEAMLALTQDVADKFIPLNKARSNRNKAVYTNEDNLVDLANKAKEYIATILDTNSLQYKAIARIKFKRR